MPFVCNFAMSDQMKMILLIMKCGATWSSETFQTSYWNRRELGFRMVCLAQFEVSDLFQRPVSVTGWAGAEPGDAPPEAAWVSDRRRRPWTTPGTHRLSLA